MKKDMIVKRIYCAALAALLLYGLSNDVRGMLSQSVFDTGMILRLMGLVCAGYFFLHPQKLNWGKVDYGTRVGIGAFLNVGGGFLCAGYLFFGIKFGYPENWKIICAVTAFLSVTGYLILPFERRKK